MLQTVIYDVTYWLHHHRHFELLLMWCDSTELFRLVMTWRNFNHHQSLLI